MTSTFAGMDHLPPVSGMSWLSVMAHRHVDDGVTVGGNVVGGGGVVLVVGVVTVTTAGNTTATVVVHRGWRGRCKWWWDVYGVGVGGGVVGGSGCGV